MQLLMHWQDGKLHSCDETCYNASQQTVCTCICKGANHGAGIYQAIENNKTYQGEAFIQHALISSTNQQNTAHKPRAATRRKRRKKSPALTAYIQHSLPFGDPHVGI